MTVWQAIVGAIVIILFVGGGIYSTFIVAHSFFDELVGGFLGVVGALSVSLLIVGFVMWRIIWGVDTNLTELKNEFLDAFRK